MNEDTISSIVSQLELSSVVSLCLTSISLSQTIFKFNNMWRNFITRDFGFLPSFLAEQSVNRSYYETYKEIYSNSYNLKCSSILPWIEYVKKSNDYKNCDTMLNVSIGSGIPHKRNPLPPHKILKGL